MELTADKSESKQSGKQMGTTKGKTVAIAGTVGVPATYGGFETLAENLALFHDASKPPYELKIYCSSPSYSIRLQKFHGASLQYVPLNANGLQSIIYDITSLLMSAIKRDDVVLLLGVSGAIGIPLVRLLSNTKVITNVDGVEWRREKWSGLAKWFLRASEKMAVRYSNMIIADNAGIAEHIMEQYGLQATVIPYGGDQYLREPRTDDKSLELPATYALSLCRIVPENNVAMTLEAFSRCSNFNLVFVGDWHRSSYGKKLREKFSAFTNITLLDPIYDLPTLTRLRERALIYVHGHSAGGTNPSLVEAMHFSLPILAFDCNYNRYTTGNSALYFRSTAELETLLRVGRTEQYIAVGGAMRKLAEANYTWRSVSARYFDVFEHALQP